jgi:hypothetical protein
MRALQRPATASSGTLFDATRAAVGLMPAFAPCRCRCLLCSVCQANFNRAGGVLVSGFNQVEMMELPDSVSLKQRMMELLQQVRH